MTHLIRDKIGVYCRRWHRVMSYKKVACVCGIEHRLYRCRMRAGGNICGWERLIPPMKHGCYDDLKARFEDAEDDQ